MWTRDANLPGKWQMTWYKANKYIKRLNDQRYAGYSDWRLPSSEELITLVRAAENQGVKEDICGWLNKIGFRNVQSDGYWSSTSYANYTDNAWLVNMWNGNVFYNYKSLNYYVWPVRSGQ